MHGLLSQVGSRGSASCTRKEQDWKALPDTLGHMARNSCAQFDPSGMLAPFLAASVRVHAWNVAPKRTSMTPMDPGRSSKPRQSSYPQGVPIPAEWAKTWHWDCGCLQSTDCAITVILERVWNVVPFINVYIWSNICKKAIRARRRQHATRECEMPRQWITLKTKAVGRRNENGLMVRKRVGTFCNDTIMLMSWYNATPKITCHYQQLKNWATTTCGIITNGNQLQHATIDKWSHTGDFTIAWYMALLFQHATAILILNLNVKTRRTCYKQPLDIHVGICLFIENTHVNVKLIMNMTYLKFNLANMSTIYTWWTLLDHWLQASCKAPDIIHVFEDKHDAPIRLLKENDLPIANNTLEIRPNTESAQTKTQTRQHANSKSTKGKQMSMRKLSHLKLKLEINWMKLQHCQTGEMR